MVILWQYYSTETPFWNFFILRVFFISFLYRSLCLQLVWSMTSSSSLWSSLSFSTSFLGSSLTLLLTSEVKSRRKRRFWKRLALFVVSVYVPWTPNTHYRFSMECFPFQSNHKTNCTQMWSWYTSPGTQLPFLIIKIKYFIIRTWNPSYSKRKHYHQMDELMLNAL